MLNGLSPPEELAQDEAKQFLACFAVRAAPFALLSNLDRHELRAEATQNWEVTPCLSPESSPQFFMIHGLHQVWCRSIGRTPLEATPPVAR